MLTQHLDIARPHVATLTGDTVRDTDAPLPGQLVAAADSPIAGLFTYWSCRGDINYEELTELWADAGGSAEHLPAQTTAACALRYAVNSVASKHGMLSRPLRQGTRKVGLGWCIVREYSIDTPAESIPANDTAPVDIDAVPVGAPIDVALVDVAPPSVAEAAPERDPLGFEVIAIVRAGSGDRPHVTRATAEVESELLEAYAYYRGHLTPRDMAAWLPARVFGLSGLAVRPHGGAYFVPATGRDEWNRIVKTLRAISQHKVYGVPVLPAEDTAAAVLDAMSREAEVFADQALEDMPGLGPRGRESRLADTARLMQKLTKYETLFGEGRLSAMRDLLCKVQTAVTIASIVPPNPDAV